MFGDHDPRDGLTNAVERSRHLWRRLRPVRSRIRSRFEVDTRSLAALRIALASILLVDLLHRARHIGVFYTDDGAYPLDAYEATFTQFNGLSVHALSGDLWFQQLLFGVAGLFAIAFLVGYRTRLMGLVSLLLLFSLHARNPAVLNGGDRLLRVLLLVSLVAPLGERWSVDALRRGSARASVASFATAAVLAQPLVVFTTNAIRKHRGNHWYAGDGVEIALHNDTMSIFLGNVLVEYPALLTALNYAWVILLAGSALFLLVPVGRLRAAVALAYIGMFGGMLLTMSVGVFPLGLMASVLPFLTAPFWDTLASSLPSNWTDRLPSPLRRDRFGPPVERRLLAALRRGGHNRVATTVVTGARSAVFLLGVCALLWILVFSVDDVTGYEHPEPIAETHIDQQDWGLYAPDPAQWYAWYVTEARLENRSLVDPLDGGPVSFDRPPDASKEYETFRHRKFMQAVRNSAKYGTSETVAKSYAEWTCGQARSKFDQNVTRVSIYRMVQPSPLDGSYGETDKQLLIDYYCSPSSSGSGTSSVSDLVECNSASPRVPDGQRDGSSLPTDDSGSSVDDAPESADDGTGNSMDSELERLCPG